MWEQLAAEIQRSEQVALPPAGPDVDGRSSAEGRPPRAQEAPATVAPPPQQQQRQQPPEQASDEQLQAAMQEAAMEGAGGRGWWGW